MLTLSPVHPLPPSDDAALGLYIHVPFCVSKCGYCAFSSMTGGARLMEPYVSAVLREMHERASAAAGRMVTSVYLGGGTPSLLPPAAVATLVRGCRRAFVFAPDAELTIEANPETVTPERVTAWLDAGMTRVSMGIQALEDQELLALNRPHTASRAIAAFHTIRAAGARNISVDLLYGLPGQAVDEWRDTVRRALDLAPEHLSAYALTPETGTPIGSAVSDGRLALPAGDLVLAQEEALHDELSRSGFTRYEISNYAKPGFACRHNMLYWRCDDWLGFGASAHSHLHGRRWWNRFETSDYLAGIERGDAVAGYEELTEDQRLGETLAFGLRMIHGVSRSRLTARFGPDAWRTRTTALQVLSDRGWLEDTPQAVRLTPRGLDFADSAAALLV
ncbi:MAG: radical SAM family heme chaperone HemW [Nitrospirota bacterium]